VMAKVTAVLTEVAAVFESVILYLLAPQSVGGRLYPLSVPRVTESVNSLNNWSISVPP
jgi:hypothetical protein